MTMSDMPFTADTIAPTMSAEAWQAGRQHPFAPGWKSERSALAQAARDLQEAIARETERTYYRFI
jgi:hypothetical protein